jgi:hypothetical protein
MERGAFYVEGGGVRGVKGEEIEFRAYDICLLDITIMNASVASI